MDDKLNDKSTHPSSNSSGASNHASENIVCLLLAQNKATLTFTGVMARRMGLTVSEFAALEHLRGARAEGRGLTQAELGSRLLLSSGAVTALVDRLEGFGYVERRANPEDRRSRLVYLTSGGVEEGRRRFSSLGAELREVIAGLTEEERAAVAKYVRGVTAAIERHARNEEERAKEGGRKNRRR